MTAKTTTERQRGLRARRLAEGLAEVRGLYLPSEQHAAVKKLFRPAPAMARDAPSRTGW